MSALLGTLGEECTDVGVFWDCPGTPSAHSCVCSGNANTCATLDICRFPVEWCTAHRGNRSGTPCSRCNGGVYDPLAESQGWLEIKKYFI